MSVLTECLYMHHGMLGAYRSQKESVVSPWTRATDGCEWSWGFWELNQGPLQENHMLLTAEPSL